MWRTSEERQGPAGEVRKDKDPQDRCYVNLRKLLRVQKLRKFTKVTKVTQVTQVTQVRGKLFVKLLVI